MKRWGWLTLALVLAMTGGGCSTVKETVADYAYMARERGLSEAYVESLQQWSREETAYSQFETRFHISATYKSPAFREAFLKEQARLLALPPEAQEKREAQERDHAAEVTEFFFYAYTADREVNDFGERRTHWRVFLLDETGHQVEPLEVRRISPVTPFMETFYPYIKPHYGFCYSVKFPRQTSETLTLVFTSFLGRVDLSWPSRRNP
jgi:hypothetical protein